MKNLSELLSLFEYKLLWPSVYGVFKSLYRQDKTRILFADPYATGLTDNMKPIYAALEKNGGYKLICCFPTKSAIPFKIGNHILKKACGRLQREVTYWRFLKEYAKCGTLFLSESYLPAYAVKRREGTQVVQLWHGSGAFKKWGYSTLDKDFGADRKSAETFPMHNCYTLVPVSSAEVSPHYAEAFGIDGARSFSNKVHPDSIIRPLGVPRTDVFFDKTFVDSAKLRLYCTLCGNYENFKSTFPTYNDFSTKRVVIYAPTFRGKNITSAASGLNLDFEALKALLPKGTVLLVKLHPFVKKGYSIPESCKDCVFDVSNYVDTNTLLCASDLLITDYSSIIFEYSLLSRPMIFYAYDLYEYTGERDFYYPYENFIPGKLVKTQPELVAEASRILQHITESKSNAVSEVSVNFANKYMSACDGNSTERILKELHM